MDAAISKNSSNASAAAVASDEDRNFLSTSALVLEGCADPETAEVVACREGLALASDLGLQTLRVASDCVNAVASIHDLGFGRVGPIVPEKTRTKKLHKGGICL